MSLAIPVYMSLAIPVYLSLAVRYICHWLYRYLCHWLYRYLCHCTGSTVHVQPSDSIAIFLHSLTPIFFRYFSVSSNRLFLSFPTDFFPSGVFVNAFLTVPSCGILFTRSNRLHLRFLISEIIFGFWLVLILHTPFSFTGSDIFLNTFRPYC